MIAETTKNYKPSCNSTNTEAIAKARVPLNSIWFLVSEFNLVLVLTITCAILPLEIQILQVILEKQLFLSGAQTNYHIDLLIYLYEAAMTCALNPTSPRYSFNHEHPKMPITLPIFRE